MNALEIKNLNKDYGGFAIKDLNLTVPSGCIVGLIGENGAGKSTTMKLILDMIERDSGSISVLGLDNKKHISQIKEDVGVVFENAGIHGCLTPTNIAKIMEDTFKNWDNDKFFKLISSFSLSENQKYKEFSRGMKMKLAIAIAMSHDPKLLLLDEATSGLDPVVRDEILDMFLDFTRDENRSILMSSHIVSDLEKVCDYIAFLHNGKLIFFDEKDRIREKYGILRCSIQELRSLDEKAVIGSRITPYGAEAIVRRDSVFDKNSLGTVDVEQLFIFMAKKEDK